MYCDVVNILLYRYLIKVNNVFIYFRLSVSYINRKTALQILKQVQNDECRFFLINYRLFYHDIHNFLRNNDNLCYLLSVGVFLCVVVCHDGILDLLRVHVERKF